MAAVGRGRYFPRMPPWPEPGIVSAVTQSLCRPSRSLWGRDERSPIVRAMLVDLLAVVLAVVMFAVLWLIVEGIDRI